MRTKKMTFGRWKKEVKRFVDGLPMIRAAAVIRSNAQASLDAGQINTRTYYKALDLADTLQWRVKVR